MAIVILLSASVHADPQLVLNFSHLSQADMAIIKNELKTDATIASLLDTQTPGELASDQLQAAFNQVLTPHLSGFPVLYAGYITSTDEAGLAILPLRHAQEKLYIAVTPDIRLIHVKGQSFSHAEYLPDRITQLALYKCEKLLDDKEVPFWRVTKIERPDDSRINPISVIILTNPDNIFVQTGDIKAASSEQLVLPPIRVVGNQDKNAVALRLLDIKPYFEEVKKEQKRANPTTTVKITTTY
jgi:hypothetical protein